MTQRTLDRHLSAIRSRDLDTPEHALRHTLRSLARRWLTLYEATKHLQSVIEDLLRRNGPLLLEQFGIGVVIAAEISILARENPERIQSEAAFAKLAGISPVPTGSGVTSGSHRINHDGHRQLNAAIYRTVVVRMRLHEPTIAYVARRTTEGERKKGHHSVPQAMYLSEGLPPRECQHRTGEIAS